MSTYTIGETASRSGFSASALRYYEDIGLVAPSTRTDAGYRLYDDGTLTRLAFIARAKQLGCTLDEIVDLVGVWDGERCGPVQKRFHDLVTDKLSAAERQIAELTALTGQLRHAAALLSAPPIDGPCDEGCACLRARRSVRSGRDDDEGRPVKLRTGQPAVVGIGAAACAACCAGPVFAFLGALAAAGIVGTCDRVSASRSSSSRSSPTSSSLGSARWRRPAQPGVVPACTTVQQ